MKYVKKRDGNLEKFDKNRILFALERAFFEVNPEKIKDAKKILNKVLFEIEKKKQEIISVEEIQDIIENVLEKSGYKEIKNSYHIYRLKKERLRKFMDELGVKTKLTINAITVLEERYLLRDSSGKIIETPAQLFRRVANTVAEAEKNYNGNYEEISEKFYKMMAKLEFLPNSPTLFNANTELGQLSACFVLPIEDSLQSIFETVKRTAIIEQTGGGVGFSFSKLRPKGDIVKSTHGVASGPVSFMRVFDVVTDVIKAGGKRRGAMMGVLHVSHPDILEFINSKLDGKTLQNFNISVAIDDKFMDAVKHNKNYDLINPRNGEIQNSIPAREIWNKIIEVAWKTGDPGVIFIDEINRRNPTSHIGKIESTNPCGEVLLHPYESCNLGSINLVKMLKKENDKYIFDWEKFKETIEFGVRFLDNVIDVNKYPYPEIEKVTKDNRRIGLGIMGFADMLILLGIPYNSKKALKLAEDIAKFISNISHRASEKLAYERGSFPNFNGSKWQKLGYSAMRNATTTAIAPTGSISIIAGVSSGIEPIFAVAFIRNILGGKRILEINPIFEMFAKKYNFYSTTLMLKIAKTGSIQNIKEIPNDIKDLFLTAHEISPEQHIKMQATFQKYIDNSVSKTINFKENAKISDVKKAYELAYKLKCKGITIYRYGSKEEQVLYFVSAKKGKLITAEAEYSGGCPTRHCPMPN